MCFIKEQGLSDTGKSSKTFFFMWQVKVSDFWILKSHLIKSSQCYSIKLLINFNDWKISVLLS